MENQAESLSQIHQKLDCRMFRKGLRNAQGFRCSQIARFHQRVRNPNLCQWKGLETHPEEQWDLLQLQNAAWRKEPTANPSQNNQRGSAVCQRTWENCINYLSSLFFQVFENKKNSTSCISSSVTFDLHCPKIFGKYISNSNNRAIQHFWNLSKTQFR